MGEMQEITRSCKDCGNDFIITIDDQLFYQNLGYSLPVRCKACRHKRRVMRGKEANDGK